MPSVFNIEKVFVIVNIGEHHDLADEYIYTESRNQAEREANLKSEEVITLEEHLNALHAKIQ